MTILMAARIMVMVRAQDLPDHRPHVMMDPSTDTINNTRPITTKKAEPKAIIISLVNTVANCSRTSGGSNSHPPAPRKTPNPIKTIPPNNVKRLTMPCKIVRTVIPVGRTPR